MEFSMTTAMKLFVLSVSLFSLPRLGEIAPPTIADRWNGLSQGGQTAAILLLAMLMVCLALRRRSSDVGGVVLNFAAFTTLIYGFCMLLSFA